MLCFGEEYKDRSGKTCRYNRYYGWNAREYSGNFTLSFCGWRLFLEKLRYTHSVKCVLHRNLLMLI